MCKNCDACFSEEEKTKLESLGWDKDQIEYAEYSLVENKIKELINK